MELYTGTTADGLVIDQGVLVDGKNCEGEITVPLGTVEIKEQAFYRNKKLTGLILPQGLTTIGKYAVSSCENLTYIVVPESVIKLGEDALVIKFESNFGFTHVVESKQYYPEIRCKEGSFIDETIKQYKEKDGWDNSHSNEHLVTVKYL